MKNDDYGYFGKGLTGYVQYDKAFKRNFGGGGGGGGCCFTFFGVGIAIFLVVYVFGHLGA